MTTSQMLKELNNLYHESQSRQMSEAECQRMQELYDAISNVAAIGMMASPRDLQYFHIIEK